MMKHLNKFKIFLVAMALLFSQEACKKDWLDVNYNPRELTNTSATPDLLLAPLLEWPASFPPDFDELALWMGYWCSPSLPPATSLTNYTNVASTDYANNTIFLLEEKAAAAGQDFYVGISKVLRALYWSRMVDNLNNVPYTEAFQASILHPKYDSGQYVYDDLMKQLTLANGLIKNADITRNPKLAIADIMFHGDRTKWLQFINTLKLRLLIHQANRVDRAAYISTEINAIKAEGSGFLPTGVDAAVNPGYNVLTKVSPYYGLFSSHNTRGGSRGDLFSGINSVDNAHANVYAMNLLKADSDPRLGFIYSSTDQTIPVGGPEPFVQPGPSNFRGSRLGLTINTFSYPYQNRLYLSAVGGSRNTDVVNNSSAGIIKGNNMDAWIMTSVENYFLQAEAVFRGWLPGDPELAYKTAIKESFRWLNLGLNKTNPALSDAIFDQWYNGQVTSGNINVSWNSASDKYKLIMYQKYMALNGVDPRETWTDYRRNGRYPNLPLSVDPTVAGNVIPIRFVYSADEYLTNTANVNAQGTISMFTGKIWWMP